MTSFFTDLLFLHGYIHDWRLARRLRASRTGEPTPSDKQPEPAARHADSRTHPIRSAVLCLGIGDGVLRHR